MPRMRPEISAIVRYQPGRPIEEVAAEFGLTDVAKLASNENPLPPFAEVTAAIRDGAADVNRYPDSDCEALAASVGAFLGLDPESLWFGAGSTELISVVTKAVGGPGAHVVFPWPSFAMYPVAAMMALAESSPVDLDADLRLDLDAMAKAIRPETSLVFVCNPNNPTGTHRSGDDVRAFIEAVPSDTLVVVDEAYAEYVVAGDYHSMIPLAIERPNVVVSRTFSKIYGLAGLRVGYLVGRPETLGELKKAQIPFSVNSVAQRAAIESLRHADRLGERVAANREGLEYLAASLAERRIPVADSQANFVWAHLGPEVGRIAEQLMDRGVIIRVLSDEWARITIGTPEENHRFIDALDAVMATV